jgi:DnaJ-class molecular chaperone
MNIKDALNLLELTPRYVNPANIKKAYKKACSKYHPDRNAAGLEMMKLINLAYEAAKNFEGEHTTDTTRKNYGEAINEALYKIINFGLDIEICGAWV